jgi:hypothetical protein
MREIRLPEGLHVGHAVRPPYPAKYELGVVFLHAFVRVSTPNVARPPLTINMKGHGRLKGDHNRIYQTYLLSYLLFLRVKRAILTRQHHYNHVQPGI